MTDELNCIDLDGLSQLLSTLKNNGYRVIGPKEKEETIIYDDIDSLNDLPIGLQDIHKAGSYKLVKRDDKALFGYNVGPQSWKQFLFPPKTRIWRGKKQKDGSFKTYVEPLKEKENKLAFIGVRACDLSAISIQDNIFIEQSFADPVYSKNRKDNLIIAVNCGQAASTCFCTSMSTGPKVNKGYDLALTEILIEKEHYFLVETGSNEGKEILQDIPHTKASHKDLERANTIYKNTESQIGKKIDLKDIKELLYRNYDNHRWAELEKKCLACGNCTMVCPTCFCSKIEDTTDLKGEIAERWKNWDSCYSSDFSYIHGGSIRPSIKSKYRQWLMHKLATWFDQFGSSGCVGCGRCISWCPVGIDLTEEVKLIRESEKDNSYG